MFRYCPILTDLSMYNCSYIGITKNVAEDFSFLKERSSFTSEVLIQVFKTIGCHDKNVHRPKRHESFLIQLSLFNIVLT